MLVTKNPAIESVQQAAEKKPTLTPAQVDAAKLETLQAIIDKLASAEIPGLPGNSHFLISGDSPKAWEIRQKMLDMAKAEKDPERQQGYFHAALYSLSGTTGAKALAFIGKLKSAGAEVTQFNALDIIRGDSSPEMNDIRIQCLQKKDLTAITSVLDSLAGLPITKSQQFFDKILTTLRTFKKDDFKDGGDSIEGGVAILSYSLESALESVDPRTASQLKEKFTALIKEKTGIEHKVDPEEQERLKLYAQNGRDTKEAWEIRIDILKRYGNDKDKIEQLADSLKGIGSAQAEDFRKELLKHGLSQAKFVESYAGVDTEAAWALREKLYKDLKAAGKTYASGDELFLRVPEDMQQNALQDAIQKLADAGKISNPPSDDDKKALQSDEKLYKEFSGYIDKHIIENLGGVYLPPKDIPVKMDEEAIKKLEKELEIPSIYTLTMSMSGLTSDRAFNFIKKMTDEYVPADALFNVLNESFEPDMNKIRRYFINTLPAELFQDVSGLTGGSRIG